MTTYGITIAAFVLSGAIVAIASYWSARESDKHRKDVERRFRALRYVNRPYGP